MRKSAKWIIGLFSVGLVLFILVMGLIQSGEVNRFALRQLILALNSQGILVEAESLDLSLTTLSATAKKIKLRSSTQPTLPAFATMDHVQVKLNSSKVFHLSYWVDAAVIEDLKLSVYVDGKGITNLPVPPDRPASKESADVLIRSLVVRSGSIQVDDRLRNLAVSLPAYQLEVKGDPLTKNHTVQFRSATATAIQWQGRKDTLNSVEARMLARKDGLTIESLQMNAGDSRFGLQGTLQPFHDLQVQLNATLDVDLTHVGRFAGLTQPIGGKAHAGVAITGPPAKLQITGELSSSGLTIEPLRDANVTSTLSFDVAAQRLQVASARVQGPDVTLTMNGELALLPEGFSRFAATVQRLDLSPMSHAILPVRLATSLSGSVQAHWKGLDYEKAIADGKIQLQAPRQVPRESLPLSGSMVLKAHEKQVAIDITSLRTFGVNAQGRIDVDARRQLTGNIKAAVSTLADTVNGWNVYSGTRAATDLQGPAQLSADLGGSLQSPTVAVELSAPQTAIGTLRDVALQAKAQYANEVVTLQTAKATWREQSIHGDGTVGLRGASPSLQLSLGATNASLESVLAGLGHNEIPVRGAVTVQAQVAGTVKNPLGSFSLSANDLHAYGEPFGALAVEGTSDGKLVTVSRLHLDKAAGETLDASGTYTIPDNTFTANAASNNLSLASLTLPGARTVRGDVNFTLNGRGTLEDPQGVLKLHAANLMYGEDAGGSLDITAQAANRIVTLAADIPLYHLHADARVGVQSPYPAEVELQANAVDVAKLPLHVDIPFTGTITGALKAKGSLSDWEKADASAHLEKMLITYRNEEIKNDGPVDLRYQAGTLHIDRAELLARQSRLSLAGVLPSENASGNVKVKGDIDLSTAAAFLPAQDWQSSGKLQLDGEIRGTWKKIDPSITVALENGSITIPGLSPFSNVTIRARLLDGSLTEEASAKWASAQLSSSGEIPLGLLPAQLSVDFVRKQGPAKLTAQLKNLDLASMEGVPNKLTGTISARLEVEAPKADIASIQGRLQIEELKLKLGEIPFAQKGVSTILVQNQMARVEQFELAGTGTGIRVSGTVQIDETRKLDLKADGTMDAALFAALTDRVRMQGPSNLQLTVGGTAASPQINGFLEMTGGTFSTPAPRLAVDNLNTRLELSGNRVTVAKLEGSLNGGSLKGGGDLSYQDGSLRDVNLNVQAGAVYLEFPKGLKTVSDVNLTLRGSSDGLELGGKIGIEQGSYKEQLTIQGGLLEYLRSGQDDRAAMEDDSDSLLSKMTFRLDVESSEPLVVDNNLAKAELDLNVRLVGDYTRPGMTGRITINEGGELTFSEKKYTVERGGIIFTNEQRIEPILDIQAHTQAAGYDISMLIQGGGPEKITTTLTSDPPLPQSDILAILITGRTQDEIRGAEADVAKEQVLSYLTGSVGAGISSQLQRATGLSQVRIEPNLIANEADPSARLTVGQNITKKLNLVYSMNLVDSRDQIYITEYAFTPRFLTRFIRQNDNTYRWELRQTIHFGGTSPQKRKGDPRLQRKVGEIHFLGEDYFPEDRLRGRLKVKTGQHYDFFKIRKGLDRIEGLYSKESFHESKVRLTRDTQENIINLSVNIDEGPRLEFVYEGWSAPAAVQKKVRSAWQNGAFDAQRLDDARRLILAALAQDNFLDPEIETEVTTQAQERKRVLFTVHPGVRYQKVEVLFEGAGKDNAGALRKQLEQQKLLDSALTDQMAVQDSVARYYHQHGYLNAKVLPLRVQRDTTAHTAEIIVPVTEGPLFHVRMVEFSGNTAYTSDQLIKGLPLEKGETYTPGLREDSIGFLRDKFGEKGYNRVDIGASLWPDTAASAVDVKFTIAENRKEVVRDISVEGNQHTSQSLVLSQLKLKPGSPVTPKQVSDSRRNLYATGAYSLVDLEREPLQVPDGATEQPVHIRVKVREIQPFEIKYGGYYDTDRGPGGIIDIANRNSLGSARVLGFRGRYDSDLQEARLYFTQPPLMRFPLITTAAVYDRKEVQPAFITDRIGVSIQQEAKFHKHYILNYGYSLENAHTFDREPDQLIPFDITLRVATLRTTISRETRDDLLDATKGSFTSQAFEWSPESLGSQIRYVRYVGQYFKYFPLKAPRPVPFGKGVPRSRLVFATGVRVGIAEGLGGQDVTPSKRFFAGGGTTVRGFDLNGLGPRDVLGDALGGNAMLILNNEIRFPLFKMFDGVAFVDAGNVYPRISDFSLSDIRKSGGFGIRLRTPYLLLRLDYGIKLDRKPGEGFGKLFFSIGQAF